MTLWWIGDIVLLLVVIPIVAILLGRVLGEARAIVPSVNKIRDAARRGSQDLDAVPLLLTTQEQVKKTVEGVANYGGSLDVIIDDAE
jgi:ABC-type methionine transport system permease subunit